MNSQNVQEGVAMPDTVQGPVYRPGDEGYDDERTGSRRPVRTAPA
ncbi:hypothetical protein [Spirillospora sp. CA-128828]